MSNGLWRVQSAETVNDLRMGNGHTKEGGTVGPFHGIYLLGTEEGRLQVSIDSIKALAELVGEPEIIPLLDGCGKHTLVEVGSLLHSLVASLGHPCRIYRARLRNSIMNEVWDRLYEFDHGAYMRWLILDRIEHQVRAVGIHGLNQELRILANLWDMIGSGEDLDVECECLEDWDQQYLEETYLSPVPSPDAVANTAGRAIHYATNGDMIGTVSAREAIEYFGWEI